MPSLDPTANVSLGRTPYRDLYRKLHIRGRAKASASDPPQVRHGTASLALRCHPEEGKEEQM